MSGATAGRHLRGLLNDLKRRPEDAARELGVPVAEIEAVLAGRSELGAELIERALKVWPVSERDFFGLRDDCPDGVKLMRAEASARSARVMERAGGPYYEYRDTAMSAVAPFRPEWIRELCVVEGADPDEPRVQWNNGHFMHQFTYFVGPVNFYYRGADGGKRVARMDTGDSMYITPFVPHTFAVRRCEPQAEGLILALTYGNKLAGDAQHELEALGGALAARVALDFSTPERAGGALLRFHREGWSLPVAALAARCGLAPERIEALEQGRALAEPGELARLAEALRVHRSELMPPDASEPDVVVRRHADAPRWRLPDAGGPYELVELAGTRNLPHSKALELTLHASADAPPSLGAGLHQYVYCLDGDDLELGWTAADGARREVVRAGDSFTVKPGVAFGIRGRGRLLLLRVAGRVVGEAQRELSFLGRDALGRAVRETAPWFDAAGRSEV